MKTSIAIITASLFVAACGPTVYVKPGASEKEFNKVRYECMRDAAQSTSALGPFSDPIIIAMERNDMIKMCMEANGWSAKK